MRTSERVYAALREEILEGTLAPGAPLGEIEQSERLGVSRTPLREALSRLQADGLVEARGGRGLVVTGLSPSDVQALFELRAALEVKAAGLAAARRDRAVFAALREDMRAAGDNLTAGGPRVQFYGVIARMDAAIDEACGSPYLRSALRSVRAHVARLRRASADDAERLREATHEHLLILDAIVEGSPAMAAHATELHLHRSLASIVRSLDAATAEAVPSTQEARQ